MVAYDFHARLAAAIEAGDKAITIRIIGQRRHARIGERLQLYTGQRTRACRKLVDPDPVVTGVQPITFHGGDRVWVDTWLTAAELEALARLDGFSSAAGFLAFHEPQEGIPGTERAMITVPDWRPAYLTVLADLRRARATSGLTQAEVAARLGIHMRTLRRWENGEGDPPAGMLFRWAAVVGVGVKVDHGANLPHREPGEPIVLRNKTALS